MKNRRGFSWPETMVALTVLFLITMTLLPLFNQVSLQLEEKRRKYHASVVMHEAAKKFIDDRIWVGSMKMDNLQYSYMITNDEICVDYAGVKEEKHFCVTISNGP